MEFLPFANRKATLLTAGAIVLGVAYLFSSEGGPFAGLEHKRSMDSPAANDVVHSMDRQIHLVRDEETLSTPADGAEPVEYSSDAFIEETNFASDEELIDSAEGFDPTPVEPAPFGGMESDSAPEAALIN